MPAQRHQNEESVRRLKIHLKGQRHKVAFCGVLLSRPDILFLDEPTNHLDIWAIEWLERYLRKYTGTVSASN
ncbi:hypothetical protein MHBO_001372 [Bonamia ostreae]|uniref:ABC transporter domain-containing protein n=1 Tax=Bonamia ostreae TaxID=126728 RepID=A0ABV2AIQ6_9EUKA